MKKIIIAALLTIPFSGNVIAQNNNQSTVLKTDSKSVEAKSDSALLQQVAIYEFRAENLKPIKDFVASIEGSGYSTSTASLSGLEGKQHNSIFVFKPKNGQQKFDVDSRQLDAPLFKQVKLGSKTVLPGNMPERAIASQNDFSSSVVNTVQGKSDDGSISLTQYIELSKGGKNLAAFDKVGVAKNGAILNVIRTSKDSYVMVLTAI